MAPPKPPHHPTRQPRAGAFARLELSSRREARVPHALARRGSPGYARARATTLGCEQLPLLSRERTDTRRPSPCARDREAVRALLAGVRSASVWTVSARREPAPWSTSPTTCGAAVHKNVASLGSLIPIGSCEKVMMPNFPGGGANFRRTRSSGAFRNTKHGPLTNYISL